MTIKFPINLKIENQDVLDKVLEKTEYIYAEWGIKDSDGDIHYYTYKNEEDRTKRFPIGRFTFNESGELINLSRPIETTEFDMKFVGMKEI